METFSVTILGCKVNQYEGEQIAALLRRRGLRQVDTDADLRIVHTCSVTVQAASKSRQTVRRNTRKSGAAPDCGAGDLCKTVHGGRGLCTSGDAASDSPKSGPAGRQSLNILQPRVVVSGCWATSHQDEAAALPGVDAVIPNEQNIHQSLDNLVDQWLREAADRSGKPNVISLPQMSHHQANRQRALLKIQDGCDAHCTYCIIPTLRSKLSSKPVDEAVREAQQLVQAGHQELVLTGIFLGAYGQSTALRRRQEPSDAPSLAALVESLCTQVPGLQRLRLSSLEPGDLTDDLIQTLRRYPQVVPHFHLPLQSGSDRILRRMNRQYSRDDFLCMLDRVHAAFDRPALTTDVIVGFPGETDAEFDRTVDICRIANFLHIHAFSFSPRPDTAAARWTKQFVRGPIVNHRITQLTDLAVAQSFAYRQSFLGQNVQVLVESPGDRQRQSPFPWNGRTERYFPVQFQSEAAKPGILMNIRIEKVTVAETWGFPLRFRD